MSTIAQLSLTQYERMVEAGVFEGALPQHLEFLRGVIVQMNPIGAGHSDAVSELSDWSYEFTDRQQIRIRVQMPLRIPILNSEPEPDLLWAVRKNYSLQHPEPQDVLLLIEVADSSLETDHNEKLQLYAEAGIVEYWVINLTDQCIEVYREPTGRTYQWSRTAARDEVIHPLNFPEAKLQPSRIFVPN